MELRELAAALRSGWWFPALGLLLGCAIALGVGLLQAPLYSAQTQLFVSTTSAASSSDAYQGGQFSQERVASYAQLLQGEELAGAVVDQLQLDLSPTDVAREITASPVPETVLLDVTVTDPSPTRARDIAAAIGTQFGQLVSRLETPAGASTSPVRVTVVDAPEVPSTPAYPRTFRNVVLGAILGLVIGAACAVLRVRLDRTVRDADEAAALGNAPVIGMTLRDSALQRAHLYTRGAGTGTVEAYRQLGANLQYLDVDQPPRVIMISSAMPAEGKTTLAVNLALSLAEAGRQVVLVEADLRRPRVTRYLGMVGGVGLTNILSGSAELQDVQQSYGDGRLSVVGSGPPPPNPSQLLASSRMVSLIEDLRVKNDFVVIDAPPLLPVADATNLAVIVDGTVLAIRYGKTHKQQVRQAQATLQRVGAKTLGLVLNLVPPKAELASAYGTDVSYAADAVDFPPEKPGRHAPDA
ncbi:polysaccharide biosynthesis tyrosine autokinase [Geodermatophilus sp. SYSU D00804]